MRPLPNHQQVRSATQVNPHKALAAQRPLLAVPTHQKVRRLIKRLPMQWMSLNSVALLPLIYGE